MDNDEWKSRQKASSLAGNYIQEEESMFSVVVTLLGGFLVFIAVLIGVVALAFKMGAFN